MKLRSVALLAAMVLLAAGCTDSSKSAKGPTMIAPFDAEVLRALRGKDIAAFIAGLPPAAEPPRKLIDAEYDLLPLDAADPTHYVLMVHRATRQLWVREGSGKTSQFFGPATYNPGQ